MLKTTQKCVPRRRPEGSDVKINKQDVDFNVAKIALPLHSSILAYIANPPVDYKPVVNQISKKKVAQNGAQEQKKEELNCANKRQFLNKSLTKREVIKPFSKKISQRSLKKEEPKDYLNSKKRKTDVGSAGKLGKRGDSSVLKANPRNNDPNSHFLKSKKAVRKQDTWKKATDKNNSESSIKSEFFKDSVNHNNSNSDIEVVESEKTSESSTDSSNQNSSVRSEEEKEQINETEKGIENVDNQKTTLKYPISEIKNDVDEKPKRSFLKTSIGDHFLNVVGNLNKRNETGVFDDSGVKNGRIEFEGLNPEETKKREVQLNDIGDKQHETFASTDKNSPKNSDFPDFQHQNEKPSLSLRSVKVKSDSNISISSHGSSKKNKKASFSGKKQPSFAKRDINGNKKTSCASDVENSTEDVNTIYLEKPHSSIKLAKIENPTEESTLLFSHSKHGLYQHDQLDHDFEAINSLIDDDKSLEGKSLKKCLFDVLKHGDSVDVKSEKSSEKLLVDLQTSLNGIKPVRSQQHIVNILDDLGFNYPVVDAFLNRVLDSEEIISMKSKSDSSLNDKKIVQNMLKIIESKTSVGNMDRVRDEHELVGIDIPENQIESDNDQENHDDFVNQNKLAQNSTETHDVSSPITESSTQVGPSKNSYQVDEDETSVSVGGDTFETKNSEKENEFFNIELINHVPEQKAKPQNLVKPENFLLENEPLKLLQKHAEGDMVADEENQFKESEKQINQKKIKTEDFPQGNVTRKSNKKYSKRNEDDDLFTSNVTDVMNQIKESENRISQEKTESENFPIENSFRKTIKKYPKSTEDDLLASKVVGEINKTENPINQKKKESEDSLRKNGSRKSVKIYSKSNEDDYLLTSKVTGEMNQIKEPEKQIEKESNYSHDLHLNVKEEPDKSSLKDETSETHDDDAQSIFSQSTETESSIHELKQKMKTLNTDVADIGHSFKDIPVSVESKDLIEDKNTSPEVANQPEAVFDVNPVSLSPAIVVQLAMGKQRSSIEEADDKIENIEKQKKSILESTRNFHFKTEPLKLESENFNNYSSPLSAAISIKNMNENNEIIQNFKSYPDQKANSITEPRDLRELAKLEHKQKDFPELVYTDLLKKLFLNDQENIHKHFYSNSKNNTISMLKSLKMTHDLSKSIEYFNTDAEKTKKQNQIEISPNELIKKDKEFDIFHKKDWKTDIRLKQVTQLRKNLIDLIAKDKTEYNKTKNTGNINERKQQKRNLKSNSIYLAFNMRLKTILTSSCKN